VVAFVACDQHRLRLEERAEGAQAVRPEGAAARHEVDDRVCETEARRHLDRAGDVDEHRVDAALLEQPPREVRIRRRHVRACEMLELGDRRLLGDGSLETAASEAEPQQLGDVRSALAHEIRACDSAVDDAVLHPLGHVGRTDEQHVDRRVPARERERALAGLLRAETCVVEQGDRRLAQPALRRDGDRQAVALALRRFIRSSTKR
jgi:hypothetical protein